MRGEPWPKPSKKNTMFTTDPRLATPDYNRRRQACPPITAIEGRHSQQPPTHGARSHRGQRGPAPNPVISNNTNTRCLRPPGQRGPAPNIVIPDSPPPRHSRQTPHTVIPDVCYRESRKRETMKNRRTLAGTHTYSPARYKMRRYGWRTGFPLTTCGNDRAACEGTDVASHVTA